MQLNEGRLPTTGVRYPLSVSSSMSAIEFAANKLHRQRCYTINLCACVWVRACAKVASSIMHTVQHQYVVVAIYSHFLCDREHLLCMHRPSRRTHAVLDPWSSNNASEACSLVSWSSIVFWKGIQHPSISIFGCTHFESKSD